MFSLQVDIPPADVHAGFAIGLTWYHAGQETEVVYIVTGSAPVLTNRNDVYYNDDDSKWLVSIAGASAVWMR